MFIQTIMYLSIMMGQHRQDYIARNDMKFLSKIETVRLKKGKRKRYWYV